MNVSELTASRRIWMYTTQFNELLNFVCMYPDTLSEIPEGTEAFGESKNTLGNKAKMMDIFKGFDQRVLELLEMAEPSSVRLWQLLDMDPPPIRHAGKLCLIGDAALPFLPHIGQGAASALEDAASITALLPLGTIDKDIPDRLKLYEECRKGRAEEIHSFSRLLGRDLEPGNEDARINRNLMAIKYFPYIFGHDEYDHTSQRFREHLYEKVSPSWNMPTSFGPMPASRQTFQDTKEDNATFVRSSFKFKTSRPLLANLLPKRTLEFVGPGSIAFASFTYTAWSDVSWLGGHGYNQLDFYIHGVQSAQHTTSDRSNLLGSFLAVSFTDSADVITDNRENLGFPSVFCDLKIQHDGSTQTHKASWRGTEFIRMCMYNAAETTADTSGREAESDLLFVHRYVPGTGSEMKPTVDSVIRASLVRSDSEMRNERCTASGELKVTRYDVKRLPTLHHIVERLAELPILEDISVTLSNGTGKLHYDDIVAL